MIKRRAKGCSDDNNKKREREREREGGRKKQKMKSQIETLQKGFVLRAAKYRCAVKRQRHYIDLNAKSIALIARARAETR